MVSLFTAVLCGVCLAVLDHEVKSMRDISLGPSRECSVSPRRQTGVNQVLMWDLNLITLLQVRIVLCFRKCRLRNELTTCTNTY